LSQSISTRNTTDVIVQYPRLSDSGLVSIYEVDGRDHRGINRRINVVGELPLIVKVDGQELVTLMTLGTYPEKLVLGYLRNQILFQRPDEIRSINVDWNRQLAEVITFLGNGLRGLDTNMRMITTGCGQGTVLSCNLDRVYDHRVKKQPLKQSEIYRVLKVVSRFNKTYRRTGSIHGCGLYHQGKILIFIEDVGRHNAMDTISGEMWLRDMSGDDKILYTTGRLTSEIVMKSVLMGISVLISRNGTTHMGYELAKELGVTLIMRAKSRQFTALNADNLIFDNIPGE